MSETVPEYADSGDEHKVAYTNHTGPPFPVPHASDLPGGMAALRADYAALQAQVQALTADKERLLGILGATLTERDRLRADRVPRVGVAAADRFRRTCAAWERFLPYAQQAAIVAGLLQEGEAPHAE